MGLGQGLISTIISGATAAATGIGSAVSQARGRRAQREFEQKMYDQQKQDRIDFWNLENQYNSPEAQMQRLKAAGLNPNLVYGNGATATGGSIDAPEFKASDLSQNYGAGVQALSAPATAMNTLYDLRIKDAQANLLNQKVNTEQTIQNYNAVKSGLTDILQQSEQLKLALGTKTFDELVRQAVWKTQQMAADLSNTRADTTAKTQSANLAGAKTTETNLSNELLELEKNLYKGTLGLPSQSIEQILKLIMLVTRKK